VSLLNVKGSNPFLRHVFQRQGNYDSLYFYSFLGEVVAIKVFTYPDRVHAFTSIKSALREFAIMRLCSTLECGPSL
jgi:hypothetical protein